MVGVLIKLIKSTYFNFAENEIQKVLQGVKIERRFSFN